MEFGMIVFFLSVFVSAQTVIGHGVTSRCKWNNMILQRRVASLFHRNKELMCMVEKVKPKECRPACGEYEVCNPAGTCECGDKSVRDSRGLCVLATPIECTPACGKLEVCTTGGTCECGSSSIRNANGTCVPAVSIKCTPVCGELEVCTTGGTCECVSSSIRNANGTCVLTVPIACSPACGELEVCTTEGKCECGSSSIRDANGACVSAVPIECTPACGEGEVCSTEGKCVCGPSLARDGSGNCVPATTGYCGPTCLTSTCTSCGSDIISGEITLNLATGETLGNLTGATVESMAVTSVPEGANVDCNFKARVKVTFEPKNGMECSNLLRIQMTLGMTLGNGALYHFGDSITNVGGRGVTGDYPDTQSHDAEMLRFGSDLTFIESTHGGSCDGGFITNKSGGFSAAHATVLLAHQYGRLIMNGDGIDEEWCDECAFELNDAVDTSGAENRDLYLAFNRLVQNEVPGAGDGYGVCSAKLSWVCNVANP